MALRKAKPKKLAAGEEDFRRRWAIRRFPNTNIARDLEPWELAKRKTEAGELGISLPLK